MAHDHHQQANTDGRRISFWRRQAARFGRARRRLRPGPYAWRGAALALIVGALLAWLWATAPQLASASPFALLIAGTDLLAAPLAAAVLLTLLGWLSALPRRFRWILATALVLLLTLGSGPSQRGWFLIVAVLVLALSALGGALGSIAGGWSRMRRSSRLLSVCLLGLAIAALGGAASWLLGPGAPAAEIPNAALQGAPVAPLNQADPSQPGPYAVATLTYGSGQDRQRPEYGAQATLTTASVDASRLVQGWSGLTGAARTAFWGFDAASLPINGRVWHPAGAGPFPLALIVHGNSRAEAFSDPGFAYLGELLASRGFIVASVDENFLNTGLIDRAGGLTGVNAARGWLLLEHLRVWHAWNAQPGHPFYRQIDTQRIALIGHSRGGEAVAVAAALNRLARFPDDATAPFASGYGIRSVVAIAPSDAQYQPLGEKVALDDINYLAIHGSHDADVSSFVGLNQYQRVSFRTDGPWIKAALSIYRANHSQFNTTWGRYDLGQGLAAHLIDTAALLPAEEQRKAAQVFISAFLEATLHDAAGYRPLFRDARLGRAWLPATVYLGQYADSATRYLSTFEEDVDVVSTTLTGGSQEGANLAQWTEQHVPLRAGAGDNRAVRLAWTTTAGAAPPRYTITLPANGITLTATSALRFDLADAGSATATPINLTIELRDAHGDRAQLPLSHVAPLQPLIEGQYLKSRLLHDRPLSEPIFQTFNVPLTDFAAANAAVDPTALAAITFVFNDTPTGTILLDNVGIAASD